MTTHTFRVNGLPAPQGSKKAFRHGDKIHLVEQSTKTLVPWREDVKLAALRFRERHSLLTIDAPVRLDVTFFMPKPKSVKRLHPSVAPDLSKLIRGLEDALTTAHFWRDDCLVVEYGSVRKVYATDDLLQAPGALISVTILK